MRERAGLSWDRMRDAVNQWQLRPCDSVGARPVLRGRPRLTNYGELSIGDDFSLASTPVRSHIFVAVGATVRIGNRVRIDSGAAISCYGALEIDDDVSIGAFAIILDSDFHLAEDRTANSKARQIKVGRGARIGHRVIVLPGSTIGENAIVLAGSVVSGDVPPGQTVDGNPARVHLPGSAASAGVTLLEDEVPNIVMRVLGLPQVPHLAATPREIPQWDSLGTLRLILALEERFSITLSESELKSAGSVRQLVARVEAAQARRANSGHAAA